MPELPEVEIARCRLSRIVDGKIVRKVSVRNHNLRLPVTPGLEEELTGQVISAIERRGKYLILRCPAGSLLLHLGMTGDIHTVSVRSEPGRHDHLDIHFDDDLCIRFHDPRRFGAALWTHDEPMRHELLKSLGPEPLTDSFSGLYLFGRSRGRTQAVKQFIMDGTIVAGLGNIYAAEALFRAGIHPLRKAGKLSEDGCLLLADAVKSALTAAIHCGIVALDGPRREESATVYFPVHLAVYGRSGMPCRSCGSPISRIIQGGRSSWFCPGCQKLT